MSRERRQIEPNGSINLVSTTTPKGVQVHNFWYFYEKDSLISVLWCVEILCVIGMEIYGRYVYDLKHIKKYNHRSITRTTISRMQQSEQQTKMVLKRMLHYNRVLRSIIYQQHFNSDMTLALRYIKDRYTLNMLIFMMTVKRRVSNR